MRKSSYFDLDRIRDASHETLIHKHERWGMIRADLIKRTGLGHQETKIGYLGHVFLLNLEGVAKRGEDFIDGHRISFLARRPGSIVYIPDNSEWRGWDEGDATASYLLLSIEKEFTERAFGTAVRKCLAHVPPSIGFRDGAITMALQSIAVELKHPDSISVTMVESQVMQVFVQMFRLNRISHQPAKGGLSAFDLKRTIDMMETCSGSGLTLTDLAREVGISRFHFCRAFKQSMGMTPYAFFGRRRLERSAEMLRSTHLSATDIAMECGFGSSSHFAVAFKRAFGISPIEYRRRYSG